MQMSLESQNMDSFEVLWKIPVNRLNRFVTST